MTNSSTAASAPQSLPTTARRVGDPIRIHRHTLRRAIPLVALTYLALALAGGHLALPPGYASPFAPASGLAVAALLVCGVRCWPGVWLGAFLFSMYLDPSGKGATIAMLIASASTVQALLGVRLTRRFFERPIPLMRESDAGRFLVFAGPVACLVAATLGVATLYASGRLTLGELAGQWLTWWAGDTIGVVLIAPVALLIWPGTRLFNLDGASRIALPLLITAGLLSAGHVILSRLEANTVRQAAEQNMRDISAHALVSLPATIESLRGVERFLAASRSVTREEFAIYTDFLTRRPEVIGVDWAPRVLQAERGNFLASQQRTGMRNYRILDLDADTRPIAAQERAEYFPIVFSEPQSRNSNVLGIDHGFEAPRRAAMARARDSGKAVAAAAVALLRTRRPALLVFVPVYRLAFDSQTVTPAIRRDALRGFVVGVFDVESLLATLAREAQAKNLTFSVSDITGGAPTHVLMNTLPGQNSAAWSQQIEFADRTWRLDMQPANAQWAAGASDQAHLYSGLSVLVALLVAFASLGAAGRAAATGAEVAERTADLEQELGARKSAEAALRETAQDLDITLHCVGDAVLATDANGRVTRMNRVAEQLMGWPFAEARGRPVDEVFRIINEDTRQPAAVPVHDVLRTGEIHGLANHTALISRDGTERAIADSAAPIRDIDGTLRGVVLVFRDVSQERTAERALRASEARYRQFIDRCPLGVFVHCNGDLAYLNPRAVALFGARSGQDLVGRPVLDLLHPDSREGARERIRLVNLEGIAVPARAAKWLRIDGSWFFGESTAVPCEHEGQPAALVLLQDITARKEAEDERDRFFDLSLDLLCIAGTDGHFKRVNRAFGETLGWSEEELLARPFLEFVHPDDIEETRREVQKLATGEPVLHFENRYLCKDGSWRWLTWKSAPTPEGLRYATARDTTREHQIAAEMRQLNVDLEARVQTLHDKEQEIGAIVNNLLDCVVMIDAKGVVHRVNPALERVLGYTAEEVVGRNVALLMPDEHRNRHDGYLGHYLKTGEARIIGARREVEGRHKDGRLIPLELSISEYAMAGERLFLGTLRDIRERKAFIAELTRARADAEQASQAKSAFLATMSHEIRTPMNGVIGLVDVLTHSKLSEHQTELVDTIRQSASALLGIIDDILDFSKIEAGRLEFESLPVRLSDLVEGLCATLVPVAARKDVDLSLFISPELPEIVLSDDVRLRQILYNLLGNAIKFSGGRPGQRGRVAVRVQLAQRSPFRISFAIADNGIGMTRETLDQLFTPFTQAEVATTRRFGGTGLGLAICKRLVELMHGEIVVVSKPGEASTFTVTLPFEVPDEQPAHSKPDLSGVDCILLESEGIHSDDLRIYLEHAGARVHVADATDALRIARARNTPVVIIHDAMQDQSDPAEREQFASAPDVRHLIITRGRRQRARLEGPETVSMDGNVMRRQVLLRAVAVAAGRASPEQLQPRSTEQPLTDSALPIGIAEARAQGRLILVAEDDDINQKVILQQLRLLGYAAEVAGNGAEALQLWKRGEYALLLTDLHMPEMDGYALAQAVRHHESGRSHIPIIALTANALRGEANRAHTAGMDGYLTKPIQLSVLQAALQRWMPATGKTTETSLPTADACEGRAALVVDVDVLRGMVGDDPEIVEGFLRDYLASARRLGAELRAARASGNTRQVGAIAHKLKSSSRSIGALGLGDRCAELENASKAGDKSAIARHTEQFEAVLAEVEAEITELLQRSNA